ncbi:hypothetical protein F2Q70_00031693 [Brassica cretica]|uniref:Uncharacterized protein n=1 Tax=Brassica cretica TaxID=69181 RepID=A0A8S9FFQ9_BRACR|nr:hypothetical protein F2Q70_00031693 [Brassica cretica]
MELLLSKLVLMVEWVQHNVFQTKSGWEVLSYLLLGQLVTWTCASHAQHPKDLCIPLSISIFESAIGDSLSLPAVRSDEAETLHIVLSTMSLPLVSRGTYQFLWRTGARHFVPNFLT